MWRRIPSTRIDGGRAGEGRKALVDGHCADAEVIRIVLDKLSTYSTAAFYDTFELKDARRNLRKPAFHHVHKHASWLNMVEIEIGVLKRHVNSNIAGE